MPVHWYYALFDPEEFPSCIHIDGYHTLADPQIENILVDATTAGRQ